MTALRKAELLALEWADVDFENAVLRVQRVDDLPDSKGNNSGHEERRGKRGPLSQEALEILSIQAAIRVAFQSG